MTDTTANRDLFVVDDDGSTLQALALVFRRAGWRVRTFADPLTAVAAAAEQPPACMLLDVMMPTRSGLDVLSDLQRLGCDRPVIMMSGAADVPIAVAAMRRGAVDVVQKPFAADAIVAVVDHAVRDWTARRAPRLPSRNDFPGHALLTRRERDVLGGIAQGATAKQAALALSISPRTVEFHRARILEKLGAKNAADLMRIVLGAPRERAVIPLSPEPALP